MITKAQLRFLRDAIKAGYKMILLPDRDIPTKFEVDVVYVTREQKERETTASDE